MALFLKHREFLVFNLFFSTISCFYGYGQHYKIKGEFKDIENGENVQFVNICIKGTSLGTTSNSEGRFDFSLPEEYLNDSLTISFVGYESLTLPTITLVGRDNKIFLKKSSIILNEVFITSSSSNEIIRKCIQNIPINYFISSVIANGHFISVAKENNLFASLTQSYESVYFKNFGMKSHEMVRHSNLIRVEDLRADRNEGQDLFKKAFSFDHVSNLRGFLNYENLYDWEFEIAGRLPFDKDTVLVIKANYLADQKLMNHLCNIFINYDDFAILKIEFDYNWYTNERGLNFRNWSGTFQYKQFGKKYFLNHFSFSITKGVQKKKDEAIDTIQHIHNEWIMNDLIYFSSKEALAFQNDSIVSIYLKEIQPKKFEDRVVETTFFKRVKKDLEQLKQMRLQE